MTLLDQISSDFSRLCVSIPFRPLDDDARRAITAKQIAALAQEFGLRIISIAPDIICALTAQNTFSVRSATAILEGTLTPLFAAHSAEGTARAVHLCGTVDDMRIQ